MSSQNLAFSVAFALSALIGTPIVAQLSSWLFSQAQRHKRLKFLVCLTVFIIIIVAAILLGLSIHQYEINVIFIGLAYVSYGVVAAYFLRIQTRPLGILFGSILSLPIIAGFLLGTIGFLAAMFIVAETVPGYTTFINDDVLCTVTAYGNATTSVNGYQVVLTKPLPIFSFIEYRLKEQKFDSPRFGMTEACNKVTN